MFKALTGLPLLNILKPSVGTLLGPRLPVLVKILATLQPGEKPWCSEADCLASWKQDKNQTDQILTDYLHKKIMAL